MFVALFLCCCVLRADAFLGARGIIHGLGNSRVLRNVRAYGSLAPIENMKAQELKAELDLRGVSWAGCYDKKDLQDLLVEARANGKCNPDVLRQFNDQVSFS